MLQQIAPYFGFLASLFLIIALLVNTDANFRIFSILGTVSFIIYGIIFAVWPVLLTNSILFVINSYYLVRLYLHPEDFELIEFKGEEKLTRKFLAFYDKDINAYFPEFRSEELAGNLNFVVLRDLVIANIFSAELTPTGDATVRINYTAKKYRDNKIGKFIFEKEKVFLLSKGVKRIVYNRVFNKSHAKFLERNGFTLTDEKMIRII
ncbi:MAG: hypothetical protein WKF88_11575 [Ferruginibacter sp.]